MSPPEVAVFDLDGTLTRRDTFRFFLISVLLHRASRWPLLPVLAAAVLVHVLGWRDNTWLKAVFLRSVLGGLHRDELAPFVERFVERVVTSGIRPGGLVALARHRAAGARLVLATASPDVYALQLGVRLGFDDVVCTRIGWTADGRVSGTLDGGNCYGAEKFGRVERLLAERAPQAALTVYSDHHADRDLLRRADHAFAVRPTRQLMTMVSELGLEVIDWG